MTWEEAKDKVAIDRGYESFNDYCRKQNYRLKIKVARAMESLMDEAAELYTREVADEAYDAGFQSCFLSSPKQVNKEEYMRKFDKI